VTSHRLTEEGGEEMFAWNTFSYAMHKLPQLTFGKVTDPVLRPKAESEAFFP
jgi:hypothetical protein